MIKPLIVGQAPARRGDGEPLSGYAGRRLSALCGVMLPDFLERFERRNLLSTFAGKSGKGDRFPMDEARVEAFHMRSMFRPGQRVVLLGRGVAIAFGLARAPLLRWMDDAPAWVAIAPHPSGVSRWWNEPENVRRAQQFWRELACATA